MSAIFKIPYGTHASQFGVLRIPDNLKDKPLVIMIHGGFWQAKYDLEENNPINENLAQRGYVTWNIEYRRVGEDGGGWPGTFMDVVEAVNHLLEIQEPFQLNLSSVVIIGHSSGGHLALWLASLVNKLKSNDLTNELMVPIQGVISLAGVIDLKRMWEIHKERGAFSPVSTFLGGTPKEIPERYHFTSPIEKLPLGVKQILIHGEMDRHVPSELSERYYKEAIKHGEAIQLFLLPEVEHFMVINPETNAWKSVILALETHFE